jgi:uncharacterized membrane-anchored protein YitT (DUF2179 family)
MEQIMKIQKTALMLNIRDFAGIIAGCAVAGFGLAMFLIPFKASPGGAAGVAQVFFYLFIIGVIVFGRMFGVKTMWGILWLSLFTDFFASDFFTGAELIKAFLYHSADHGAAFTNETLLAVTAGSILLGMGCGLVIRFNGSTGGSDIPALLIRRYFGFTVGMSYLMVDGIIIFTVGIIFKNANLILWGFISLYITTRATDFIVEGISYTKELFIISRNSGAIREYILTNLDRGCTILKGEGGYTGEQRDVIYLALHTRELPAVKAAVKELDPDVFVVVNDAYEVFGDFRR